MNHNGKSQAEPERIVLDVGRSQLQHFTGADRRCRGLELPEGVLLRFTMSQALYFYLRTGAESGHIVTRVFASDSPYDRQKTEIGTVRTPMFEPQAEHGHIEKVECLVRDWVDFVSQDEDSGPDFKTFALAKRVS